MTKEELLARLNDIEWNDFEVKEASGGLPKSMWETVSAFSNTEGGWIILGVKEKKTTEGSVYVVNGVPNPEQMEQDIITTLRSRTKFNASVSCKAMRYKIDGKNILAFEIPLSPHRPVAIKSNGDIQVAAIPLPRIWKLMLLLETHRSEPNQKWRFLAQVSMTSILTQLHLTAVISVISIGLFHSPHLMMKNFAGN